MRPDWKGGAAVAGGEVPERVEGPTPGNGAGRAPRNPGKP